MHEDNVYVLKNLTIGNEMKLLILTNYLVIVKMYM